MGRRLIQQHPNCVPTCSTEKEKKNGSQPYSGKFKCGTSLLKIYISMCIRSKEFCSEKTCSIWLNTTFPKCDG